MILASTSLVPTLFRLIYLLLDQEVEHPLFDQELQPLQTSRPTRTCGPEHLSCPGTSWWCGSQSCAVPSPCSTPPRRRAIKDPRKSIRHFGYKCNPCFRLRMRNVDVALKTPHANGMQYSFDGEYCGNGRGGDIYANPVIHLC